MMIATTPRDNIPTLTLHTSPAPDIQISNSAQHTQYAQHLLRMQEDSPLLVSLFDSSDCLRYANRAFRVAYGLDAGEEITFPDMMRRCHATRIGAAINTADVGAWLAKVSTRRGKVPYRAFEADLCDGRWIWMTESLDAHGWMMCVGSDIAALRANGRGLRQERDGALRAAQVDALTGISNRAHIVQQLEARIQLVDRAGRSCGLVMLDLDHFKAINDTHGHHGGDLVLKHFANTVLSTLRRRDGFGRVGGEEFMLLLPETGAAAVERAVQRILQQVRQAQPLPELPCLGYTCSAGLVMLQAGMDFVTAFQLADQALYAAKRAGRDQLMWAPTARKDTHEH